MNNNSNNKYQVQELNCNKPKYSKSLGCKKMESISSLIFIFFIYIYSVLNFMSYSNSPNYMIDFETDDGYGNKSNNHIKRYDLLCIISGFSLLMLILLCYNIYNVFKVFKN